MASAGECFHDEDGMVLLMSREWPSDGSDETEVEIRGCESD